MNTLKSLFTHFDTVIIIDTETTGLDYKNDEIIELAAMKITSYGQTTSIDSEIDTLIRLSGKRPLPKIITEITGISEEMLLQKGISKAEACESFSNMFGDSKTLLAAYNAQFDLCFIYSFLSQFGKAALLKQVQLLDALAIYKDRRDYPHKLSDAITAYSLNAQNTHRAIDDVRATYELLLAMETENDDLHRYVNLFGYNPKYGISGKKISSVTYVPHDYNDKRRLYEKK